MRAVFMCFRKSVDPPMPNPITIRLMSIASMGAIPKLSWNNELNMNTSTCNKRHCKKKKKLSREEKDQEEADAQAEFEEFEADMKQQLTDALDRIDNGDSSDDSGDD